MVVWLIFLAATLGLGILARAPAIIAVCALFLGLNGYQFYSFWRRALNG
jgi:hypothetical protein